MHEQVEKSKKKMAKHFKIIHEIQEACPHLPEYVTYKNDANTGNYDPSCDSYWADYHCTHCDKRWRGDQGEFKGTDIKDIK